MSKVVSEANQCYYYNCPQIMQSSEAISPLEDINKEIYDNLCGLRSASEILQDLEYSSIKETCFECTGKIDSKVPAKCCSSCQRGCHQECLEILAARHSEVRKKLTTTGYECVSCIDFNRCMECKNQIDLADIRIYSCSICRRKVHQRCSQIPSKIMTSGDRGKYKNQNQNHYVCIPCLTRFGIKGIIDTINYNNKDYYMVVVGHPSPIHRAWIEDNIYGFTFKGSDEQMSVLASLEPQIQVVLSMHVPQEYKHYTVDKIWDIISNENLSSFNRGAQNTFKFFTKWRHTYKNFVWQEANIFQNFKNYIFKFLHQLKMNGIASHVQLPITIVRKYLAKCIDELQMHFQTIGTNIINGSCIKLDEEGRIIDMENIHQMIKKKLKQYINIKSKNIKAETIYELINTLYFIDKNPAPVAIFTDEGKMSWWVTNLTQKSPVFNVLSLQGPVELVTEMTQKHLLKSQSKLKLFRFHVLIVPYQNLKVIASLFNFKQILESFSLLIMDEKMTPLGRYYYCNVKIARIKFYKDNKQSKEETSSLMNQKIESSHNNSSHKRSSLTLSGSHNFRLSFEKSYHQDKFKTPTREIINSLSQKFYSQYYLNRESFLKGIFNELQRLIFLRFVLSFGLNITDREEIYDKMIRIDWQCFSESKEVSMVKLEEYIGFFMIHVNLSWVSKFNSEIVEQIKSYFFFSIQPIQVLKTITDLYRVKMFCSHFEANPSIDIGISQPRISVGGKIIQNKWVIWHDYLLCKGVLKYGIGNWDEISQRLEDWNDSGQIVSFRAYICNCLDIDLIGQQYFVELLRIRTKEFANALNRLFT